MPDSTFPVLLEDQLRTAAARPLVTFYDDATGERVELSVTTYANWVAKTAGLLQDELGLERGGRIRVDLPTHWLGPVWLGAAWTLGVAVTAEESAGEVDLVVCGPDGVESHAGGGAPVVALSLLPLGGRFTTSLPPGVLDYGTAVWGQPDSFLADVPPAPTDPAWFGAGGSATQAQLLEAALATPWASAGARLLTDLNPCSPEGAEALLAPMAAGGGTVWVRHADPGGWERRVETERITHRITAPAP